MLTTYDLEVSFRLDWNTSRAAERPVAFHGLRVIDEGQDLGLGLHRLGLLEWEPSDAVELRWLNITDTQAPFGETNGITHWFHRNDMVEHRVGLFHQNTSVLGRRLPDLATCDGRLSDGERSGGGQVNLTASGEMTCSTFT